MMRKGTSRSIVQSFSLAILFPRRSSSLGIRCRNSTSPTIFSPGTHFIHSLLVYLSSNICKALSWKSYCKCDFHMAPHVRLLVVWSIVGRSVMISYTSIFLLEKLFQSWILFCLLVHLIYTRYWRLPYFKNEQSNSAGRYTLFHRRINSLLLLMYLFSKNKYSLLPLVYPQTYHFSPR